jgi:hypothetical protein
VFFIDTIADDWKHVILPVAPLLQVSDAVNRTIWNIQTCHPNPECLILLSKISKGTPPLKHPQLIVKMPKIARGHAPGVVVTAVDQGLALDVGFMFQTSKNKNRAKIIVDLNGNNAYCIIYNFCSEFVFGVAMRGKSLPLAWLHIILTQTPPWDVPGRIVRLDLGGETGKIPDAQALFIYTMQPTRADASSQNGSGECPHHIIGNNVWAMLYSAGFTPKYWEYDFYFYPRVHAVLPHGTNTIDPYHKVVGHPTDLPRMCAFGCRIYALSPTKRRDGKLTTENIAEGKPGNISPPGLY